MIINMSNPGESSSLPLFLSTTTQTDPPRASTINRPYTTTWPFTHQAMDESVRRRILRKRIILRRLQRQVEKLRQIQLELESTVCEGCDEREKEKHSQAEKHTEVFHDVDLREPRSSAVENASSARDAVSSEGT